MRRNLAFLERLPGIFTIATVLFLATGTTASSAPITYAIDGTISGLAGGLPFTNEQVSIVAVGDSTNAATNESGIACNDLTSVTVLGEIVVRDTLSVIDNKGAGNVSLRTGTCSAPGVDWFRIGHAEFGNYNLATAIGPLTVAATYTNTSLAVNTSVGIVTLTGQALNTFQSTVVVTGALENPQPSSRQSGIGLISGWACPPIGQIEVAFDGGAKVGVPYGGARADTGSICGGKISSGFGLLFNYNTLGAGSHSAVVYADGTAIGTAQFTVTTLGGEFLTGASKEITILDFPSVGRTTTLIWQQSQQNFAVKSVAP